MASKVSGKLLYYLETWGDYRSKRVTGLDYPSESTLCAIFDHHLEGKKKKKETARASQKRPRLPPEPPKYWPNKHANAVQWAVSQIEYNLNNALWCRFVARMTQQRGAVACGCGTMREYRELWETGALEVGYLLKIREHK